MEGNHMPTEGVFTFRTKFTMITLELRLDATFQTQMPVQILLQCVHLIASDTRIMRIILRMFRLHMIIEITFESSTIMTFGTSKRLTLKIQMIH